MYTFPYVALFVAMIVQLNQGKFPNIPKINLVVKHWK